MLYHLFKYFDNVHNLPGAGMFQYISSVSYTHLTLPTTERV